MESDKKRPRQITKDTRDSYVSVLESLGASPTNIAAAKGELPLGKRTLRRRIAKYFILANMAKMENL